MTGFTIKTVSGTSIRFNYYIDAAPITIKAFAAQLPFSLTFLHARFSGLEFWTDDAPALDIIQENASVFTETGEVVIGPLKATRTKTAKCMGIYYGEGKGIDCCNIFAKVVEADKALLATLGEQIWKAGEQLLTFEAF